MFALVIYGQHNCARRFQIEIAGLKGPLSLAKKEKKTSFDLKNAGSNTKDDRDGFKFEMESGDWREKWEDNETK